MTVDDVTLYHHTSAAAADAIMGDRCMTSSAPVDMPFSFFSNRRHGNASGPLHYGEACVEVRLPRALLVEDDAFRDGERYYRVRLPDLRPEHFIAAHHPAAESPAQEPHSLTRSVDRERREAARVAGDRSGPTVRV